MASKTYTFKDPSALGRALVVILVINVVYLAVRFLVAAVFGQTAFYDVDDEVMSGPQFIQWMLDVFMILMMLALIVAPVWILRVARNAHTFGRRMEVSPIGAILWYLVPIWGLFKPHQAMAEIWEASTLAPRRKDLALVNWWWGVFVASAFLSAGARISRGWAPLAMLSELGGVAVTILFLILVRRLTRRQVDMQMGSVFSDDARPPVQAFAH